MKQATLARGKSLKKGHNSSSWFLLKGKKENIGVFYTAEDSWHLLNFFEQNLSKFDTSIECSHHTYRRKNGTFFHHQEHQGIVSKDNSVWVLYTKNGGNFKSSSRDVVGHGGIDIVVFQPRYDVHWAPGGAGVGILRRRHPFHSPSCCLKPRVKTIAMVRVIMFCVFSGKKLWEFNNSCFNVIRLKNATYFVIFRQNIFVLEKKRVMFVKFIFRVRRKSREDWFSCGGCDTSGRVPSTGSTRWKVSFTFIKTFMKKVNSKQLRKIP